MNTLRRLTRFVKYNLCVDVNIPTSFPVLERDVSALHSHTDRLMSMCTTLMMISTFTSGAFADQRTTQTTPYLKRLVFIIVKRDLALKTRHFVPMNANKHHLCTTTSSDLVKGSFSSKAPPAGHYTECTFKLFGPNL